MEEVGTSTLALHVLSAGIHLDLPVVARGNGYSSVSVPCGTRWDSLNVPNQQRRKDRLGVGGRAYTKGRASRADADHKQLTAACESSESATFVPGTAAVTPLMTPLLTGDKVMTPLLTGDEVMTLLQTGDEVMTPLQTGDEVMTPLQTGDMVVLPDTTTRGFGISRTDTGDEQETGHVTNHVTSNVTNHVTSHVNPVCSQSSTQGGGESDTPQATPSFSTPLPSQWRDNSIECTDNEANSVTDTVQREQALGQPSGGDQELSKRRVKGTRTLKAQHEVKQDNRLTEMTSSGSADKGRTTSSGSASGGGMTSSGSASGGGVTSSGSASGGGMTSNGSASGGGMTSSGSASGGGMASSGSSEGPSTAQSKGSARVQVAPYTGSLPEQDVPHDVSKALSLVREVIQERPPPSRCTSTVVDETERPGTQRGQSRLASRTMSRGLSNTSRMMTPLPRDTSISTDGGVDADARRLEQKHRRQEEATRKRLLVRQQREKTEIIKWEAEGQGDGDGEDEAERERRRKQLHEQLARERLEMQLQRAREEEERRHKEEEKRARQVHELEVMRAAKAREEEQRLREARQLEELRYLEEERRLWQLISASVQEEHNWVQQQWEESMGVLGHYYSGEDFRQQVKEEEERQQERERVLREEQEHVEAERLKAQLLRQRALLHQELLRECLEYKSVQLTPAFSFSYFPTHGPCPH